MSVQAPRHRDPETARALLDLAKEVDRAIENAGGVTARAAVVVGSSSASGGGSGVASFNGRTGLVTLLDTDVTDALGYTPIATDGDALLNSLDITAGLTVGGAFDLTGAATLHSTLHAIGQATFDLTPKVGLNTIWHAGNDGSGSGLDADLLDGKQSGNASGNIPISNGTVNVNLNADLLDGYQASEFAVRAENETILATWTFAAAQKVQGNFTRMLDIDHTATAGGFVWQTFRVDGIEKWWLTGDVDGSLKLGKPDNSLYQFFDAANNRLGLNTVTPAALLDVNGTFNASGAATFASTIGTSDFASGFTGAGWQGTASGDWNVGNLSVRGSAHFYELVIDQIRATNGNVYVTSSAKVESVSPDASWWNCIVAEDDVQPFVVGDLVIAQRFTGQGTYQVKGTVILVSAGPPKRFKIQLEAGSDLPAAGMEFVRVGSSVANRQGSIYLTADDSNAPYIDIADGINAWSAWGTTMPKVRLGKLSGITDADLGGALSGYGLYSQNVFLKGKVVATTGWIGNVTTGWAIDSATIYNTSFGAVSKGLVLTTDTSNATAVAQVGSSTSGAGVPSLTAFHSFDGGTATRVYVSVGETFGSGAFTGRFGFSLTPTKTAAPYMEFSRSITTGALTAQIAGVKFSDGGLWSGASTTLPALGDASTAFRLASDGTFSLKDKLTWNGTTLSINGSGTFSGTVTATAGSIGGFTIASSQLYTSSGGVFAGIRGTTGTLATAFFAGASDNIGTGASFKVTNGGELTATNATVAGSITASTLTATTAGSIANLTVTGPLTVDGGSIIAGSGNVTIGDNGITLATTAEFDPSAAIQWASGFKLYESIGVGFIKTVGDMAITSDSALDISAIDGISISVGAFLDIGGLPTSDPHTFGHVWRDASGFLRISSGF